MATSFAPAISERCSSGSPKTACSSSSDAIGVAYELLRRGGAEAAIAGGSESIINQLGHSDFQRVRLGIGRPGTEEDSSGYVLSEFTEDEHPIMVEMIDATTDLVEELINEGSLDPVTLNLGNTEEEL